MRTLIFFLLSKLAFSYTTYPIGNRIKIDYSIEENKPGLLKVEEDEYKRVGYDQRYPEEEDIDLQEITNHFYRKNLLNKLESKSRSIQEKLLILDEAKKVLPELDESIAIDILSGNLLDDWEFDI